MFFFCPFRHSHENEKKCKAANEQKSGVMIR
ncbi:hypothetical protein M493_03340 [Geobacillus genomosp. 3]|uniref:Uncharacterized protein n=1 Tax=Geobacillus genomosp. 3 TaxID=1921421 RepID=S5ZA04_GEOG3|nr:hypothetical protein M493_03340 [Geobacillus genomosp. 3]